METSPKLSKDSGFLALGDESPAIDVVETDAEIAITIPVCGIDLRYFHVLASSRSVVIEVRIRRSVQPDRNGPIETQIEDQRLARELTLRHAVDPHRAVVRVMGDFLQIVAQKTAEGEEQSRSELLRFDTRGSMGCVQVATQSSRALAQRAGAA